MASDLSGLDLVAIQMDGLHLTRDMVMVGAVGIDADGNKHVLGLAEGATENAATVQASTNIMESVNSVIARTSRNVMRWRNASMGLRWTAAGMLMAQQGFRRVNGHMHLPKLAAALDRVYEERTGRRSGRVAAGPESDARVVA